MEFPFGHQQHHHHHRSHEEREEERNRNEEEPYQRHPPEPRFERPPPPEFSPFERPPQPAYDPYERPVTDEFGNPSFQRPRPPQPAYDPYERPVTDEFGDPSFQRPPPPGEYGEDPYRRGPPRRLEAQVEHVSHEKHHHSFPFFNRHESSSHGDEYGRPSSRGDEYGRSRLPQGQDVRVFTLAETNYSLTIRGESVVLAPANPDDELQHWIKDEKFSTRVKDEQGFPSFSLVNKATGQALKHSVGPEKPVQLTPYKGDNELDESILWTESEEVRGGFRCIRMVNNIRLNLDAFNGNKKHGGVRDGTAVVLWEWKKGDNQIWKTVRY
ncbi:hypothetical protein AMTRI_Chr01g126290 [Amborella trichopoda]